MIRRGCCLRSNLHPRHIYVVLNDPTEQGAIVFVNFTTKRVTHTAEEIFTPLDYDLLTHDSVIAFWHAYPNPTSGPLEAAIYRGDFAVVKAMPEPTLERIIAAAKVSKHLSAAQKKLIQ